jgi:predicted ATP-dependent serine protease
VGGEELAAAQLDPADLPTLPLLGQGGYVIKEWSHLFAGYPRCGKTELLTRQAQDWIAQGLTILYITEESKSIWQHRLGGLAGEWKPLRVVLGLGMEPPHLFKRAFTGPEEVVIIDTLRSLLGLEDETDNSEVAKRLNPWIAEARKKNKTLIMAHHMRKGAGEHGEGIAGGHALLGVFDIALEILRDPNQPRRRLIRPYARLIAPPELVYELREDGQFVALGDPGALRLEEVSQRVRGVLIAEWQKTREIHEALGEPRPSLEQVRQALVTLAREGKIDRDPPIADGDAQGKAHRWRLPTSLPMDSPMVGSTVSAIRQGG